MTDRVRNPHDRLIRKSMKDSRIAEEFLRFSLPSEITDGIDFSTLRLNYSSLIDESLQELITDLPFEVKYHGHDAMISILLEHQSSQEYDMLLRLQEYRLKIWREYLNIQGNIKLPLLILIVVSNDKCPYKVPRHMYELIDAPYELSQSILQDQYFVVDLHETSDEVLRQRRWSGLMCLAMKRQMDMCALSWLKFAEAPIAVMRIDNDSEFHVETVLNYNIMIRPIKDVGEFKAYMIEKYGKTGETAMNPLIEEGRQQAMQAMNVLIEEGKRQSATQVARSIAINMLKDNMPAAQVQRLTGLSEDILHRLRSQLVI